MGDEEEPVNKELELIIEATGLDFEQVRSVRVVSTTHQGDMSRLQTDK